MKYGMIVFAALMLPGAAQAAELERATFAGGCFWCIESVLEKIEGVEAVVSGFSGGDTPDPTYEQVATGTTKHLEVAQVFYDPAVVGYDRLLKEFWANIDPTDAGGQFADRGYQYTTAIFYHDNAQKALAEKSLRQLEEMKVFDKPIVTTIRPFEAFYPAGDEHQDFYKKNIYTKARYKAYYAGSGRKDFVETPRRDKILNAEIPE